MAEERRISWISPDDMASDAALKAYVDSLPAAVVTLDGFYYDDTVDEYGMTPLDHALTAAVRKAARRRPPSGRGEPDDPCSTCGCTNHACFADCDCCPEHPKD